jgi:hypothetical protein
LFGDATLTRCLRTVLVLVFCHLSMTHATL